MTRINIISISISVLTFEKKRFKKKKSYKEAFRFLQFDLKHHLIPCFISFVGSLALIVILEQN